MRTPIRKRFGCALLCMLLLALCGCQAISSVKQDLSSSQAQMDDLLVKFMTCVENNDAQGAAALAYDPKKMLAGFSSIASNWPVRATDSFEPAGLDIIKSKDSNGGQRVITNAAYIIHCQDQDYQAQFSTCEDSGGSGFIGFDVKTVQSLVDNGIEPLGANTPSAKKSIGQWCFTVFWALCCIFCLITIIDIIRKKPKLWGLWILEALIFIGFCVNRSPNGSSFMARFGLLVSSEWTRLYNGTSHIQLCLPVGAIYYWLRRKSLQKQQQAYAAPIPTTAVPPDPTQPAPATPVPPTSAPGAEVSQSEQPE